MNFTAATCELLLRSLLAHLGRTEAFQCASEAAGYMQRLSAPLSESVFAEYLELVLVCSEHPSGDISSLASESGGKEGRMRLLDQYLLRSLCAEPTADELHLSRASSLLAQLTDNNSCGSIQPAVYRDYVRLACKSGGGDDVSRAISMLETACSDRSLLESIGAGPWNHILDTLATSTSTREDIPRVVVLFQTMRGLNVSVDEGTYQLPDDDFVYA